MAPCRLRHKTNTITHRYDSGSVEGSVIKERVLVGGMAINGVEMGLVRRQEQHIRGFKADGIVGLAFPSISTTQNTSPSQHSTFVQLLQEQFGVAGDLFSVYLTREFVTAAYSVPIFTSCSATASPTAFFTPTHLWILKKIRAYCYRHDFSSNSCFLSTE